MPDMHLRSPIDSHLLKFIVFRSSKSSEIVQQSCSLHNKYLDFEMLQLLTGATGILPSALLPPPGLVAEILLRPGDVPRPSGRPRLRRGEVPLQRRRDDAGQGREGDSKVGSHRGVVDLHQAEPGLLRNRSLKCQPTKTVI